MNLTTSLSLLKFSVLVSSFPVDSSYSMALWTVPCPSL